PMLMKLFGSVSVVFYVFVWLFFLALLLWGVGRGLFKLRTPYTRMLELCGLSGMISILGGVVNTLLIVSLGTLSVSPGPALLIRNYDPSNKLHLLASSCNLMTLWYVGVLAVGLARLSNVPAWKTFSLLFGLW